MNGQTVSPEIAIAAPGANEARKRRRLILFAAVAVNIAGYASGNFTFGFLTHLAAAWAAGGFAAASGQSRALALAAALFLPVIGPLAIAFVSDRAGQFPGAVVLQRLTRAVGLFSGAARVEGDRLVLSSFFGLSRRAFDLADLRLLYVMLPGQSKWRLTTSSQTLQYLSLDLLADDKFAAVREALDEMVRNRQAGGAQLVLADYAGNAALLSLSRLGRDPGLVEAIGRTRRQRLEKLRRWLADRPRIVLKSHSLTAAGIERGGRLVRPWEEIETFQTLTQNGMITTLTMILKETKTGRFTGKERHLTQQLFYSIPPSRKEWYSAELFFWTTLADDREVLNKTAAQR